MNTWHTLLATVALSALSASGASSAASDPPITLDTHVDIPFNYMGEPRFDVGIASDFDGGGGITGWMDASETRNVTAALRKHGFSDADIAKIWGGNLLRVWGEVERKASY